MKFVNIHSSELPEIDTFVKECINQGQWTLFKAEKGVISDTKVAFFLKAGKDFFALNKEGRVISVFQSLDYNIEMNEVIHFSDIPKPESLSNIANLGFARV
ncbi:hypothetical protein AW40_06800 [Kosakonia radicincitans UMEnt01/12]|uniref:hypothetical protein n=1 Tax=Kosakonia radicincitans TaxID=283686 RepID=UPI000460DB29|nr:hypothetical protein [Kosakonia radicincitans]KDE37366.1 hypothetical protein AW40_06800 [Kosakonia radicincitans UMEnt01/12]